MSSAYHSHLHAVQYSPVINSLLYFMSNTENGLKAINMILYCTAERSLTKLLMELLGHCPSFFHKACEVQNCCLYFLNHDLSQSPQRHFVEPYGSLRNTMLEIFIFSLRLILHKVSVKYYWLGPFFCWGSPCVSTYVFSWGYSGPSTFLPGDQWLYAWLPVLLDLSHARRWMRTSLFRMQTLHLLPLFLAWYLFPTFHCIQCIDLENLLFNFFTDLIPSLTTPCVDVQQMRFSVPNFVYNFVPPIPKFLWGLWYELVYFSSPYHPPLQVFLFFVFLFFEVFFVFSFLSYDKSSIHFPSAKGLLAPLICVVSFPVVFINVFLYCSLSPYGILPLYFFILISGVPGRNRGKNMCSILP